MDRLDAMRVYLRVVERRSFTLAAQDLGLPRSTVTDAVKQIEARLGTQLLARTTRQVRPTLDGEAYYQRCLHLLGDIEDIEASFSGSRPKGMLRVDVHGTLARHFLLPRLPEFLAAYPEIQLHMGEGDRLVDLIREGIDCVLRVGDLTDSDMVGRRVALLEQVTAASPDYLDRFGVPETLEALEGHQMVGFFSTATGAVLPLEFKTSDTIRTVDLPATVSVNGAETYVEVARRGLGIIQVPRYHLEADLAEGRLIAILVDHPPPPMPVSLLYPQGRQLSPRVRAFLDWLTKVFAQRSTAA